ncbi:GHKL domain-containing protein [[Clostridium] polysaccharolyticum]|uniref:GHKL domain-containing protein n=1 Tax=[Clostridium] polysaccharolyticum TaxID=29364 RepID=A0A1H9XZQ4_9FIRM|nr:GHKL domain-containing protein [[Clostridium] polysaccharolyticum]SES61892.1 GHKL domain-containing protein [[Clostridium] polysaccharolyticum]
MESIIEIFLSGLIDPIIWIKSMSTLGCNKSKVKYYGAFGGYYLLLVGRDLVGRYCEMQKIHGYLGAVLAVYILVSSFFLFGEGLYEKVISICIFFGALFASELIATELCMALTHKDIDSLMHDQWLSLSCFVIIKTLQMLMCYWLFRSKKRVNYFYRNKEKISVIMLLAIMLSNLLMKRYIDKLSTDAILLFQMIEIFLQWYILSSLFVFKKKEKTVWELSQEVNCNLEREELVNEIKRFQHNYSQNGLIMKNMLYYKKYDELGKYMEEVFKDVEKAELLFNHPNAAVRILISELIQLAKDMKILFSVHVLVKEFGMEDEDICSIFQNLVKNAFEAALRVPHYNKHVSLQVLDTDDGYEIRCINDCIGAVDFGKTGKRNKKIHGFGVGIVDKIVADHYGIIQREYVKIDNEEMGHVVVSIQFCLLKKS